jgi:hypothetical protein
MDTTIIELASRVGNLEGKVETLLATSATIDSKLDDVRGTLATRAGERRVALWVAGLFGGAVSTVAGYLARKL